MFDEATSALDNKTQKQVSEALDAIGCTRIVIAHRAEWGAELVERQRLEIS